MFQELRNSRSCCKKSCVRYIRKKMLNRCQIILAPVFLHKLYYEYDPNGNITSISICLCIIAYGWFKGIGDPNGCEVA